MSSNKPILFVIMFLFTSGLVFTQYLQQDQPGYRLYRDDRFVEAAAELRRAQEAAQDPAVWTETLYWLILTELSLADYGSAFIDMDELQRKAPDSRRARDIVYHRALAFFQLEYYVEAVMLFKDYADHAGERDILRKSAALYWIGECLYALDLPEVALEFFHLIIEQYPDSLKLEAASSRITEIKYNQVDDKLQTVLNSLVDEFFQYEMEYP